MRILLDTNVLLDYLQHRKGFDAEEQILQECVQYKMDGFVAAHSISNIFFILRKVILKIAFKMNAPLLLVQTL